MYDFEITRLCDIPWAGFAGPMIDVCMYDAFYQAHKRSLLRDMLAGRSRTKG